MYRAFHHRIDFNQDNIGGCMLLLQCWAWNRITCICSSSESLSDEDIVAEFVFPHVGYFNLGLHSNNKLCCYHTLESLWYFDKCQISVIFHIKI